MKKLLLLLFLSFINYFLSAQSTDEVEQEIIKATEFAIPPSPAFVMLDVTPSKIVKPGLPRAFKVDWSLKNYSIAPNLALEAQPIWLLAFNKKDLKKYHDASPILRKLSTLTFSLGTVAVDNEKTWVGLGGKLNLYQSKDPLYDPALLDSLDNIYREGKRERRIQIKEIELAIEKLSIKTPDYNLVRDSLNKEIGKVREEMMAMDISRNKTFKDIKKQYINDNWNANYLDLAFGNRFTTNNQLDTFSVGSNRVSVWLNGSYGIGKNVLVSSMLQYTQDKEVDFNQIMFGANIRYGNGSYNFFIESYFEKNELGGINSNDHYISYGGEFNINRNILLDYSLRVRNVKDIGFREFIPVVNVRCLMR